MDLSEDKKEYLREEAILAFKVIDTCLKCFYAGDTHMYKPIAGLLRLLLCDTSRNKDNSLLSRIFKNFRIDSLLPITEFEFGEAPRGYEWANLLQIDAPENKEYKIVAMPFFVTKYTNGLESADLVFTKELGSLPVADWLDQRLLIDPVEFSLR